MEPTIALILVIFVLGFVIGKVASGDHSAESRNLGGSNPLSGIPNQSSGGLQQLPSKNSKGWPTIPDGFETRIAMLMRDGKKIQAFKELRIATGLGLAESKSVAEGIEKGRSFKDLLPGRYTNK